MKDCIMYLLSFQFEFWNALSYLAIYILRIDWDLDFFSLIEDS